MLPQTAINTHIFCSVSFDHHWAQLMVENTSSVQYGVLLTGQPKVHIILQRKLRQENFLSRYLFIMCMKALVANIKKVERAKKLTSIKVARVCPLNFGIKIAMACPSIFHMFFTDNNLFFYKAQNEECQKNIQDFKRIRSGIGWTYKFQKIFDSIQS